MTNFVTEIELFLPGRGELAIARVCWATGSPSDVFSVVVESQEIVNEIDSGDIALIEQRAAEAMLNQCKAIIRHMTAEGQLVTKRNNCSEMEQFVTK